MDKELKRGKHYLHKGRIMDVISIDDLTAEVMLDSVDGRPPVRVDVHQRQIDTALCKIGGYVIVVKGINRGKRGKLLGKDKEREMVEVQLDADQSIFKCSMDD